MAGSWLKAHGQGRIGANFRISTRGYPGFVEHTEIPDEFIATGVANRPTVQMKLLKICIFRSGSKVNDIMNVGPNKKIIDICWTPTIIIGNPRNTKKSIFMGRFGFFKVDPDIFYIIIAFSTLASKYYQAGMNWPLLSGQI